MRFLNLLNHVNNLGIESKLITVTSFEIFNSYN